VTTGPYHACALSTEGAAYCWGWNIIGQLGIGTYDATGAAHATPVPVVGNKVFTSLTAGFYHTCGTVANGDVYCWGDNELAILGSGGTETCTLPTDTGTIAIPCGRTPRLVAGGASLSSIAAGSYHTCGVSSTGAVHCWGDNSVGQRGIGAVDTVTRFQSTLVSGGGSYSTVVSGDGYSCALTTAGGQAWCWGYNEVGSLGIGSSDTTGHPAPEQVMGGSGLKSLATTWYHVCGATTAGPSLCWGLNGDGQAGTSAGLCTVRDGAGSTFDISCITSAAAVASPVTFVSLAPSLYSTCGRTARSGVYCWGWNGYGQLGNGSQAPSASPVPIFGSPLGSQAAPVMAAMSMAARSRVRLGKGLMGRSRPLQITRAAQHLR
jgi:alpha-tubulin suppressor-like RCC1 family protein